MLGYLKIKQFGRLLLLILFTSNSSIIFSDSWGFPKRSEIFSIDEMVKFSIIPKRDFGVSEIGPIGILQKKVGDDYETLWVSSLTNRHSPVSGIISDDGKIVVTFDNYHSAGFGDDVIVFYDQTGTLIRKYGLEDIISKEEVHELPRSVSSIWWRCEAPYIKGEYLYIGIKNKALPSGCKFFRINPLSNERSAVLTKKVGGNEKPESTSSPLSMTMTGNVPDKIRERATKIFDESSEAIKIIRGTKRSDDSYAEYQIRIISKLRPLLKMDIDLNKLDGWGNSALYWAKYLEDVSIFLIENGADPMINYELWDSPFSQAIMNDDEMLVGAMIKAGLDLSKYATHDNSAVGDAVLFEANSVLSLLLDEGMDPNFISEKGLPMQEAIGFQHWVTVDLLLKHGASREGIAINEKFLLSVFENKTEIAIELLKKIENGEKNFGPKESALILATRKNYPKMIVELIENGVDVDSKYGLWATTPLIEAVANGNIESVNALIKYGASVNETDKYGYSALDVSNYYKRVIISKYLISKGAEESIGISRVNNIRNLSK